MRCKLCPRLCNVDREKNLGFCRMPNDYVLARAAAHLWEEPILSGKAGAGTVFFSGCTMACCFCQNHFISQERHGFLQTESALIHALLRLQEEGCHNIEFVTADHYLHRLPHTIVEAKRQGLHLPIILNTSSYIRTESLRPLEGLVDIYLPDLKYHSDRYAVAYSSSPHYFEVASAAIAEMYRQVGPPSLSAEGLLEKGMIIRHLALPALFFDSKKIIRYIHETYGNNVYLSLMNQYVPQYQSNRFKNLSRELSTAEYEALLDYCNQLPIERGFCQGERLSDERLYIPSFKGEGLEEHVYQL